MRCVCTIIWTVGISQGAANGLLARFKAIKLRWADPCIIAPLGDVAYLVTFPITKPKASELRGKVLISRIYALHNAIMQDQILGVRSLVIATPIRGG